MACSRGILSQSDEFYELRQLREWAPLTDLFQELPTKVQPGLFAQDVKLTCIDVLPDFLALGTNVGIVYWYDRKKKGLQRLRCERQNAVTALKIISTVDYMVACGCLDGAINIFQIPKVHSESIPESLRPKNKQVERYTVSDLHKSRVSAIEWSKNGMKLFSGDRNGCVVLTEIDFYMHICKSMEILNETYEVVQICYSQQRLLVSTTYRRHFGGLISKNGPKDLLLYCARPGLRIWSADSDGNVTQTLLFKELLQKNEYPEVPIINPISEAMKTRKPVKEPSFGILLNFVGIDKYNLLLTYSNEAVYILDPVRMLVTSTMTQFRGIIDVKTCGSEIFVLEEERSLVRIAFEPEEMTPLATTPNAHLFSTSSIIKDLATSLHSTSIVPIFSADENSINSMIAKAEEAFEQQPQTPPPRTAEMEKKLDEIAKLDCGGDILYKHATGLKNRKGATTVMTNSTSSLSLSSSNSSENNFGVIRPTIMNLSTVGALPDLRSPESIQSDIEYKEKILADVLELDRVKIRQTPAPIGVLVTTVVSNCDNLGNKSKSSSIRGSSNSSSKSSKKKARDYPLIPIPNEWKLSNIELNSPTNTTTLTTETESSDSFLNDWEIV